MDSSGSTYNVLDSRGDEGLTHQFTRWRIEACVSTGGCGRRREDSLLSLPRASRDEDHADVTVPIVPHE